MDSEYSNALGKNNMKNIMYTYMLHFYWFMQLLQNLML